jgi:hypothetical protein
VRSYPLAYLKYTVGLLRRQHRIRQVGNNNKAAAHQRLEVETRHPSIAWRLGYEPLQHRQALPQGCALGWIPEHGHDCALELGKVRNAVLPL